MKAQAVSVIALSLVLAACNSKPAEPEAPPTATTSTSQTPASQMTTPPVAMKPAPEGLPSRIATEVITASGKTCGGVTKADRDPTNGTILATCAGGENYRVYTEEGKGPAVIAL